MAKKKTVGIVLALVVVIISSYFLLGKSKEASHELTLYGNVDIREVDLSFRVSGKVQELFFDEGDRIKPGDLVAALDDQPYRDKVLKAANEAESINISLINAQKQLDRRKQAILNSAVSEEELEDSIANYEELTARLLASVANLGIAKTDFKDTKLFAPSSGVILTRIREKGSVVSASEPVFTLALDTPVWIRSYIAEPDLGLIYPGMKALIYTDTKENKVYQGHVGFISPLAEFTPKTVETPQLRTDLVFRLRVIVDDPDNGLRQGMPVTIKFTKEEKDKKEPKS